MANYWGYRIDTNAREYFYKEILEKRLRQGWGFNESQNLKGNTVDVSARRNFPILNKVLNAIETQTDNRPCYIKCNGKDSNVS